jgi:hypothetical protein
VPFRGWGGHHRTLSRRVLDLARSCPEMGFCNGQSHACVSKSAADPALRRSRISIAITVEVLRRLSMSAEEETAHTSLGRNQGGERAPLPVLSRGFGWHPTFAARPKKQNQSSVSNRICQLHIYRYGRRISGSSNKHRQLPYRRAKAPRAATPAIPIGLKVGAAPVDCA